MPSSASSASLSCSAPVIARWCHSDVEHLGCGSPHPTLEVRFEGRKRQASLKLRVSIGVKDSRRKVKVYLLLSPEFVQRLSYHGNDIPDPVRDAFIKSKSCASEGIVGLHFSLKQSAVILGPSGAKLAPKTTGSEDLLNALYSLAHASEISLYIPWNSFQKSQLENLCNNLNSQSFRLIEGELESLYLGKGAKVIEWPGTAAESPPSYDELALSSPPPRQSCPSPQLEPTRKKRRRSIGTAINHDDDWRSMIQEQLDSLSKQIEEAKTCVSKTSTPFCEARNFADRLDGFATQINSLQNQVSYMEERLEKKFQERLEQILQVRLAETTQCLSEQFEERLSGVRREIEDEAYERLEEAKDEMDEVLEVKLDDRLLDAKAELRESVKEELETVEQTIKADLRHALE